MALFRFAITRRDPRRSAELRSAPLRFALLRFAKRRSTKDRSAPLSSASRRLKMFPGFVLSPESSRNLAARVFRCGVFIWDSVVRVRARAKPLTSKFLVDSPSLLSRINGCIPLINPARTSFSLCSLSISSWRSLAFFSASCCLFELMMLKAVESPKINTGTDTFKSKSAQSQPLRSFSPLKRITQGRQGLCLKARSAASQFSSADSHGLCLLRRSATGLICSSGIGGGDALLPGGHGPQKGQRQGGVGFNELKQRLYPNLIATDSEG